MHPRPHDLSICHFVGILHYPNAPDFPLCNTPSPPPFPYTLPTPNHTTIHRTCFFLSIHFYHVLCLMREQMILLHHEPLHAHQSSPPKEYMSSCNLQILPAPASPLETTDTRSVLTSSHKGHVPEPTAVAVIANTLMPYSRNVIQTINQSRNF